MKLIPLFLLLMLLFSCSIENPNKWLLKYNKTDFKSVEIADSIQKPNASIKLNRISGTITTSGVYCGGAELNDSEYESILSPFPLSGFVIYVKQGSENIITKPVVDSTITDINGNFTLNLPNGNYILLQKNQLNKDILSKYHSDEFKIVDQICLGKWWKKGLISLNINNQDIDSLNFEFPEKCFVPKDIPCVTYIGPTPP